MPNNAALLVTSLRRPYATSTPIRPKMLRCRLPHARVKACILRSEHPAVRGKFFLRQAYANPTPKGYPPTCDSSLRLSAGCLACAPSLRYAHACHDFISCLCQAYRVRHKRNDSIVAPSAGLLDTSCVTNLFRLPQILVA
jgi:hypothetical protein